MRPAPHKTNAQIAAEWDAIAHIRAAQIQSGKDLSFSLVLVPSILELSSAGDFSSVLDLGCGGGFLTEVLATRAANLVAIDPSATNISIAEATLRSRPNVEVRQITVEDLASRAPVPEFTLIVANMTLMTVLRLELVLDAVAHLLVKGGSFVFTITHPCFWPRYAGYAGEPWFNYWDEIMIEAPFRISLDQSPQPVTTHVHRPLNLYLNALNDRGLSVRALREPMPSPDAEALYPKKWEFPRFLAAECVRSS